MVFKQKRGQISVEYLIVIGFVVFLVISILGIATYYAASIKDRIKINQLNNFANKVISNAEIVYFAGEPSKTTITVHLPEGVENIEFVNDNGIIFLKFDIHTSSGITTSAFPSNVPIDIDCLDACSVISANAGVKRLEITAQTNSVLIREDID